MWLIRVVTTVLMLELAWASVHSQVKLTNNGYESLVVGISPMVDEGLATTLITAIKTSMTEASKMLFSATHRKLYFKDIKILLPKSWLNTSFDELAQNERFEEADIRIKPAENHQPTTLQPGGCGEPGMYILLTPDYLMNNLFVNWWGPRGKVLTREWARYRWGVFDEMGYPNDPRFPLFYMERTGLGRPQIKLNTCTDKELTGIFVDRFNRNPNGCNNIGRLPNENCRFVPDRGQEAESSLMGFVDFDTVVEFCDSHNHTHNKLAPTRQNLMCEGQSVWEVIQEHRDFSGLLEAPAEADVTPKFTLVKEEDANFALVLDYSGSMGGTRIATLQRSSQRWILHDVANGSSVGIVRFSSSSTVVAHMTSITKETDRLALANKITTNTGGGTCIGCGLKTAISTLLVNRRNKIIILISDGQENVSPTIAEVMENVTKSGTQVVTVAFANTADKNMEKLAKSTRGKSYTVFDSNDAPMMDVAFQGALTYQPGITLTNTNIKIYEDNEIESGTPVIKSFTVDATLGRNLKFRLDTTDSVQVTTYPVLMSPSGKAFKNVKIDTSLNLFTIDVDIAETGRWWWTATLSGNTKNVRVAVTCQAKDPNNLPIYTEAWLNVGSTDVDPAKNRVIIYARVAQGDNPVVGARVRAYVTSQDNINAADEVDLLDNGLDADVQKGDGIYSRYYIRILSKGRYSVKAQVWGNESTYINEGVFSHNPRHLTRSTRLSQSHLTRSDTSERPDYCCGSVVPFDSASSTQTGEFTRISEGGSFQVTVDPPSGDYLPPSPVRDLQIILESFDGFNLTWTATGDDLDSGTVSTYEICMSTDHDQVFKSTCDEDRNGTVRLDLSASMNMSDVLLEAGEEVVLSVQLNETLEAGIVYYIGLKAVDDSGKKSGVSNVVVLTIDDTANETTDIYTTDKAVPGISSLHLILIFVGCVLLV